METAPADEGDDGQVMTLPDGSLSVPVFEERIFVEKRMVVRERVVLRKHSVTHREQVHADVRVEHVEVVAEASVRDRIDADPTPASWSATTPPLAQPAPTTPETPPLSWRARTDDDRRQRHPHHARAPGGRGAPTLRRRDGRAHARPAEACACLRGSPATTARPSPST
jgi:hypothetical protein